MGEAEILGFFSLEVAPDQLTIFRPQFSSPLTLPKGGLLKSQLTKIAILAPFSERIEAKKFEPIQKPIGNPPIPKQK